MSNTKVSGNCPQCRGFGQIFSWKGFSFDCDLCDGCGEINDIKFVDREYGEMLKEWRTEKGLTLRAAAKQYNIDPSNLSKMERGIIKPQPYYR